MRRLPRSLLHVTNRWLAVASLGMVLAFLGAVLYMQEQAAALDAPARTITTKTMRSIEVLAHARGDAQRLGAATGLALGAFVESGALDARPARQAEEQLRADVRAYDELPASPEERALHDEVARDAGALERACDGALASLAAEDVARARHLVEATVAPSAEKLSADLGRLIERNAAEVQELTDGLTRAREHLRRVAFGVHGGGALFAVLMLVVAARAARERARLAEERARVSEMKASELEIFAGRVAHDLKNPLGAMALRIDAVQRKRDADEPLRLVMGGLAAQTARMNRFIDGLLEFARSGGEPDGDARTDLRPLIEELVTGLSLEAMRRGVEVSLEPFDAVSVACAAEPLASVLSNLVRNAIKYTSHVEGRARRVRVRVRLGADASRVRVEVEDTGPGIASERRAAIFRPFVRGVDEVEAGTGLGLATVKRFVEAYGGAVGVESALGVGSCFWVELPVTAQGDTR